MIGIYQHDTMYLKYTTNPSKRLAKSTVPSLRIVAVNIRLMVLVKNIMKTERGHLVSRALDRSHLFVYKGLAA